MKLRASVKDSAKLNALHLAEKRTILVNLAPRNIKGIESQGMILMAENSKGELAFVSPVKEMDNGGGVR